MDGSRSIHTYVAYGHTRQIILCKIFSLVAELVYLC